MGISASDFEVNQVLEVLQIGDTDLSRLGRRLGSSREEMFEVLRRWVIVQNYKELVRGAVHTPLADRLTELATLYQRFAQISQVPEFMRQYYVGLMMQELARLDLGAPRLSDPLLKRFIADQRSTVKIAVVEVPAERYLQDAGEPSDEQLQALYEKYKDSLAGQSEPYGFGYKLPDRVKLEFMAIPFDRLLKQVSVQESKAIAYYDQHPDEFKAAGNGEKPAATQEAQEPPKVKPYEDVRAQIVERLRREAAAELGERIVKAAQAMLLEHVRSLPVSQGYRELPEAWESLPLETVGQKLQEQFQVMPDVVREDGRWLTEEDLGQLPGIGSATVVSRQTVAFPQYAMSVRELNRGEEHPLANLRLQAGMPAMSLRSFDGSLFIFRIIEASPERQPTSPAEVRTEVARDARRVAAFELLKGKTDEWQNRLKTDALNTIAADLNQTVHEPPAFPRREVSMGRIGTPYVPPVGTSDTFVARVFELAHRAQEAGKLDRLPPDKRSDAIPVEGKLGLYLVRVDDYSAISQSEYQRTAAIPGFGAWVQESMVGEEAKDPFSLESLRQRTGYVSAFPEEEKAAREKAQARAD
jgi:hypothetical protein